MFSHHESEEYEVMAQSSEPVSVIASQDRTIEEKLGNAATNMLDLVLRDGSLG